MPPTVTDTEDAIKPTCLSEKLISQNKLCKYAYHSDTTPLWTFCWATRHAIN